MLTKLITAAFIATLLIVYVTAATIDRPTAGRDATSRYRCLVTGTRGRWSWYVYRWNATIDAPERQGTTRVHLAAVLLARFHRWDLDDRDRFDIDRCTRRPR